MLELSHLMLGVTGELRHVRRREVGHGVALEVGPERLDGVQFWSICRQETYLDTRVTQKELSDRHASVHCQPIPNHDEPAREVSRQVAQELQEPRSLQVAIGSKRKVKADAAASGRDRQSGDDRDLLPMPTPLVQDRRLAARGPGAPYQRSQQKPALVQKNQVGFQPAGFFLSRGHSIFTHRRMESSSRSRARRSGFCGVHPIECSSRPI